MSSSSGTPLVVPVLLPWAQATWHGLAHIENDGPAPVGNASSGARQPPAHGDSHGRSERSKRPPSAFANAPQKTAAPIFRPLPEVPAEDRTKTHPDSLVSLGVALDILATRCRRLPQDATVLTELTRAALHVANLGGDDTAVAQNLVIYALTAAGHERTRLSQELATPIYRSGVDSVAIDSVPEASSPAGVAAAVQRLASAASLIVRDACLVLSARDAQEVHKG